ncbi:MAG: hypothetical protein ACK40G_16535 [Cytophagaceae bacterium]
MDENIELTLALVLILLGVINSIISFKSPERVTLGDINFIVISFFFGLSPFITLANGGILYEARTEIFLLAYGSVFCYLFGVKLFQWLFYKEGDNRELSYVLKRIAQPDKLNTKSLFIFFLILFSIKVTIKAAYGFSSYGGAGKEAFLSIPYYWIVFLFFVDLFLFAFYLISISVLFSNGSSHNKIYLYLIIIVLFITNYTSRSLFIIYGQVAFIALILIKSNIKVKYLVLFSIVGIVFYSFVFPFLFGLRYSHKELSTEEKRNYISAYQKAIERGSEKDMELIQRKSTQNLGRRAYFMYQFLKVVEHSEGNFMNGDLLINNFIQVIPRFLYPDKVNIISGAESYIIEKYQMNERDFNDNLPLYGYVEFGLIGAFLVGFCFAGILTLFLKIAVKFKLNYLFTSIIIFVPIKLALSAENHFINVFATLRECLILLIIYFLLIKLFPKKGIIHLFR